MKLVIDNTSTPGTFFDNIHNTNWLVNEYDIEDASEIENFSDVINKSSKIYIKKDEDTNYNLNNDLYSSLKYDYINKETIEEYKTRKLDDLYKKFNENFKLTKDQFNNLHYFNENHYNCRVDPQTKMSKFGTIGGGSSLEFMLNYCSEEMFPRFGFVGARCHSCNKVDPLTGNNEPYKNLDKDYESHIKYGPGLSEIEFYRFMTIYYEYKTSLKIGFMGTGLGYCISVKVNDLVFDITDTSCW